MLFLSCQLDSLLGSMTVWVWTHPSSIENANKLIIKTGFAINKMLYFLKKKKKILPDYTKKLLSIILFA